jgi:hypothetical protein
LVERIAWKRAGQQQSSSEAVASQHAEQRLNERIDAQAEEQLEKANQEYAKKYRQPFGERRLLPEQLQFSTTPQKLVMVGLQASHGKLAAPGTPPPVVEGADMTLRLHESAINNLAFDAVADRIIYEENVQATLKTALGKVPDAAKGDEDGQPWAITFYKRKPIVVTFADNRATITLRGEEYYKGGKRHPAMNVSAVYKIEATSDGFKAVRDGEIRVDPADYPVQGGGQKPYFRWTATSKLLKHRFAKIFKPEFVSKGIELSGKWQKAGKLMPVQVVCRDGWLVVAWKCKTPVPEAKPEPKVASTR